MQTEAPVPPDRAIVERRDRPLLRRQLRPQRAQVSTLLLRLVRFADPTLRKRSSTVTSFEWMYVARSGSLPSFDSGTVS